MYNCTLITGGAGFVGSSVALALRARFPRLQALVFDNLRRRGSELNLTRLAEAGVRFIHGDVRSFDDLAAAAPEPDLIIECSAEPSALAGYGDSPGYLVETNLTGCYHCLELARRSKAHFIFLSTSRVYPVAHLARLALVEEETRLGLAADQPVAGASGHGVSEDFPLDGPRSLYGMTKLAAELMVEEYSDAYGFPFVINRCGLLAGPWQMGKPDQGVLALWMASHFFRRPLQYIGFGGSGKQVRDFLHIGDFCELLVSQLENFSRYQGRRWNVGGGATHSLSLLEATALCRKITGAEVPIERVAANRPADIPVYITDARRVSAVDGWRPRRDAMSTLGEIHEWLVREQDRLKPVLAP